MVIFMSTHIISCSHASNSHRRLFIAVYCKVTVCLWELHWPTLKNPVSREMTHGWYLYIKIESVCPSVCATVSESINPLPSDRLCCCDRYIPCQQSLAVKLLNSRPTTDCDGRGAGVLDCGLWLACAALLRQTPQARLWLVSVESLRVSNLPQGGSQVCR